MTTMSPRDQRKLARAMGEIAQLRRRVEQQSRSQNLAHSTIVQGEGPQIVTPEGEVIGQVGGTPDGAPSPVGPVPGAPSAPSVVVGALAVQVVVEDPVPAGVARAEVLASLDSSEDGAVVGAVWDAAPVSVALPGGLWHLRARWVMTDGRTSESSEATSVDVEPLVDAGDIEQVLDTARAELAAATAEADRQFAELGQITAQARADLDDARQRVESAEQALGSLDGEVDGLQSRLSSAEDDIANAATEAAQNLSDLDAALRAFASDEADAAQTAAISAAAADATAKADAARDAAEAEALRLAQAEAAAQSAAEATAAADALAKANAARDAAISSASSDATAKAAAAEEAAKVAAAADAKAKADAAQAAAISAAASDAQEKADAAQAEALRLAKLDATEKANAVPRPYHETTAPTSSNVAPDGSVWFQHTGTRTGPVIAQWARVAGAWVSTPIRSEAIANLDVGKLTAGTAAVAEVVTQKLLANEAVIKRLTVGVQAWIDGVLIKDGAVTAEKITVTDELIADFFAANRALINEELVVRGNLIANHATIISAALKNLSVTEKATFAQAFADEFWAKMAVIDKLTAQTAWIGGAMLKDGEITAEHITASESLTALVAQFLEVTADQIDVNSLWASAAFLGAARAAQLVLEQTVDGITSRVSGRGLETFQSVTEADGSTSLQPLTRVGSFADSAFTVIDPATGLPLGGIGSDGSVKATTLDSDTDPVVDGVPILGAVPTRHDPGQYTTGYLDGLSWGRVPGGFGWRDDQYSPLPGGETGILEVQFMAQPGRTYEITAETGGLVANGSLYYGRIRRMIGSSNFTSSSFVQAQTQWDSSGGGQHSILMTATTEGPADLDADPVDTRLLLCVYNPSGVQWTSNLAAKRAWIEVKDVGPRRGNPGRKRSVAISRTGGGSDPEPTQPEPTTTKTTSWTGTYMRSYYAGGIQSTGQGSTMLKQGRDPYWAAGGIQSSMFLLPKSTIASAVSGASVDKAILTLRSAYAAGGGTKRIRLYWHELTSRPSSYPTATTLVGEYSIAEGATLGISLPASVRTAIQQGRLGGFSFSTAGDSASRYALGLSWSTRPKLTVTYTK